MSVSTNLVRRAIALVFIMATTAAMAASASANSHSTSCGRPAACTSLISIDHLRIHIVLSGNMLLSETELVSIENVALGAAHKSVACRQIGTLLATPCSKTIANSIVAVLPVSVTYIGVTILNGRFPYYTHI